MYSVYTKIVLMEINTAGLRDSMQTQTFEENLRHIVVCQHLGPKHVKLSKTVIYYAIKVISSDK
jgi:hypothetical protein